MRAASVLRVYDLEYKGVERGFSSLLSDGTRVCFETLHPFTAVTDLPHYRELWVDESLEQGASWDEESLGHELRLRGLRRRDRARRHLRELLQDRLHRAAGLSRQPEARFTSAAR